MYTRLSKFSQSNSFFLFGARGTGKSTLLKQLYPQNKFYWIDLLLPTVEEEYLLYPERLKEKYLALSLADRPTIIIIDEIQKAPKLLDIVHWMIEEYAIQFILTGSSARKLKRQSVNLLAGRAFQYYLLPFSLFEVEDDFDLEQALSFGMLPKLYSLSDREDKKDFLRSYVLKYIKEEIQLEQLVRDIVPFRKFLDVAAQSSGEIINYSKIGRNCGVDYKSVSRYFEILSDTFLGFFLDSYHTSVRKRQIESPKFYFFDVGVVRAITHQLNVVLTPRNYAYGNIFESFIILEIMKLNIYLKKDFQFSYLKTKDGVEIDLIVERPGEKIVLIEIKSSNKVHKDDYQHLIHLEAEFEQPEMFLISQDQSLRISDGVQIMHYKEALKRLFFRSV